MPLTIPQLKVINVTCTIVSISSAVATPFLVTKANKDATEILDRNDMLCAPLKERLAVTWKCYIPTGIVMAIGLGASGTHGVLTHKVSSSLAAEITAHAATVASNNQVKEALLKGIKDKFGLDVESEMRNIGAAAVTTQNAEQVAMIASTGPVMMRGNKTLLCDDVHKRYFYGSLEDVKAAMNTVNCSKNLGNDICLADIYAELDKPELEVSDIDWMLAPKEGELFEMTISTSRYNDETCTHFGFRDLVNPPKT